MTARRAGSFRSVLTQRTFGLFVLGQTVSQFGDKVHLMGLVGLVGVLRGAGSGAAMLAAFAVLAAVPLITLGPLVGVLVDRWDRRRTLIGCDVGRALLVGSIPGVYGVTGSVLPIYPIVLVLFVLGMFFNSAKMAMVPNLVTRSELLAANAVLTTVGRLATVLGIVLGGLVAGAETVSVFGLPGYAAALYLDSASFWFSAVTLLVAIPRTVRADSDQPAAEPASGSERPVTRALWTVIADLTAAYHAIRRDTRLTFTMASFVLLAAVAGPMYIVIVDVVQAESVWGTSGVGFLGGVLALGLVTGAVLLGALGTTWDRRWTILAGYLAMAVVLFVSARPFTFALHAPLAFAGGLVLAPIMICQDTLLHEQAAERFRGRVFAAKEFVLGFVYAVGAVVAAAAMTMLPLVAGRLPHELVLLFLAGTVAVAGGAGALAVGRRSGSVGRSRIG